MDKISITYTLLELKVMYMILKKRRKSKRWINRKWLVRPINRLRMQQGDFSTSFPRNKTGSRLIFPIYKNECEHVLHFINDALSILNDEKSKSSVARATSCNYTQV